MADVDIIIEKALELGYLSERELEGCRRTIESLKELGVEKPLIDALREHRFLTDDRIAAIQEQLGIQEIDVDPEAVLEERARRSGPEIRKSSAPDATMDFDEDEVLAARGHPELPEDGTADFSEEDFLAASLDSSPEAPEPELPDGMELNHDPDMSAPTAVMGGATLDGAPSSPRREQDDGPVDDLLSTYEKNLIGQSLGGCRLETQLGKGAMGTVFKATHLALRKQVAVKLLNPSRFYQKKHVEQFFREARAAAAIEHQNIVAVHDVGQERGLYYIVMQFIEGESLQERIKKDVTIGHREAVRIGIEAARGLAIAHQKGIVHRDIKPANIMLTTANEVKIADFGLAHQGSADGTDATGDVEIMGTPAYMSPEQIDGRKVDHRADLYSLGVTLYYMATGRKPFDAPTPMEVLLKHMSERLIPPIQVNPRIPKSLGQVIERLMAKDPDSRYSTAEELIKDLEEIDQGGKPQAVAAMEDVIHRMEEMAREEQPVVKSRQPITAAVVSGVVAAMCAILFTVALPDIKADHIENHVETDRLAVEVESQFQAADKFARKFPAEIQQIRANFTKIIDEYDFLEPWPTQARTRIRECERRFAELGEEKTKPILEAAYVASRRPDFAAALLELEKIEPAWLVGALGADIKKLKARYAAELAEQTGFALVPGGKFLAGREKREEHLPAFMIQVREVSNEEYAKAVAAGVVKAPPHWEKGRMPLGTGRFPVTGVSYKDAEGYAMWLGGGAMRLPTALEWEKAARGTDGRAYPWGEKFDSRQVNCMNWRDGIRSVSDYVTGMSPYGCLNMAGNVNEWTSTVDKKSGGRIVKGGAYRTNIWNVRTYSQIAVREDRRDPELAIGFRCVREL